MYVETVSFEAFPFPEASDMYNVLEKLPRLSRPSSGVKVIDLFGLDLVDVRDKYPEVYQWVYERVKPERGEL